MNIVNLSGTLRPSSLMKRMLEHRNPSSGDKRKLLATRKIMNKTCLFFCNGSAEIENCILTPEEIHNSEILRFCVASLLINGPVGDKQICYVDATKHNVELWIHGTRVEKLINSVVDSCRYGETVPEEIIDNPALCLRKFNDV